MHSFKDIRCFIAESPLEALYRSMPAKAYFFFFLHPLPLKFKDDIECLFIVWHVGFCDS